MASPLLGRGVNGRAVDPCRLGQRPGTGRPVHETLRVLPVGREERLGPNHLEGLGLAVVNGVGRPQGFAAVAVHLVVPGEELPAEETLASSTQPKRAGNPGRYLRVLNAASEYGLS